MSLRDSKLRCVVVTNVPTPYRAPVWQRLSQVPGLELHVVYCAGAHIDASQAGHAHPYATHFLQGKYEAMDKRFHHADWSVWSLLSSLRPDVVVTSGFIPTFLYAFAWAVAHGVPHVPMTDGTDESERGLTWKHRLVRRLVYGLSRAYIGACEGSRRLYLGYGVKADHIHLAPLCTDNQRFATTGDEARGHDLIFCSRFVQHKNPLFALDVAAEVSQQLGRRVSLRYVGQGPMEAEIRAKALLASDRVDVSFAGYLSQQDLPLEYARAKVFLFPTSFDPWGVVVNEACAAGVPCIVSPHTGVAGELVRDGLNGRVCALNDRPSWVRSCVALLQDESQWQQQSMAARREVARYTFDAAAQGVLSALNQGASSEVLA